MNQTKPLERADVSPPEVNSETLFKGRREIIINHKDTRYRLMITKQGKLILNK